MEQNSELLLLDQVKIMEDITCILFPFTVETVYIRKDSERWNSMGWSGEDLDYITSRDFGDDVFFARVTMKLNGEQKIIRGFSTLPLKNAIGADQNILREVLGRNGWKRKVEEFYNLALKSCLKYDPNQTHFTPV